MYYNTTENHYYIHNGTSWKKLTDQSMTASEILTAIKNVDGTGSGLDADLLDGQNGSYYMAASTTLNSIPAPIAALSLNSQKITNLGAPTANSTDAATTAYVDSKVQAYVNGLDPKESVVAASTGNVNLLTVGSNVVIPNFGNGFIVDGIRVLVKDQSNPLENGIYITSATAWTRAADAIPNSTLGNGSYVMVEAGVHKGSGWIYIGTDDKWTKYTEQTVISAGTGVVVNTTGGTTTVGVNFGSLNATYGHVIPKKYKQTIGDGTNTAFTISHGIDSEDVVVSVRDLDTKEHVLCDVTTNFSAMGGYQVILSFSDVPTLNQYQVVVVG
jgi:hypothetical protein